MEMLQIIIPDRMSGERLEEHTLNNNNNNINILDLRLVEKR